MKTKPFLKLFSASFATLGTLRFDENTFLKTFLGFTPYWDYKSTNAIHVDSPGLYTGDKILNLSTKTKSHLNCIDGSVLDSVRHDI